MQRDMDVVRQILLEIEETGALVYDKADRKYLEGLKPTADEVQEQDVEQYHYLLLVDAGFIRASERNKWWIEGLSWDAHDFLDAIGEESRWDGVKQHFKDQGKDVSSMPLQIVKNVAIRLIADAVSSGL